MWLVCAHETYRNPFRSSEITCSWDNLGKSHGQASILIVISEGQLLIDPLLFIFFNSLVFDIQVLAFFWERCPFNRKSKQIFKACVSRRSFSKLVLRSWFSICWPLLPRRFKPRLGKPKLHLLLHPLIYAVHIHCALVGGWGLYKSKVLLLLRSLTAVPFWPFILGFQLDFVWILLNLILI